MMVVVWVVVCYLVIGALALVLLNARTGRVRRNLRPAASEAQVKMARSGYHLGRWAILVVVVALWLLWPAAIYGAVVVREEEESNGSQEQESQTKN